MPFDFNNFQTKSTKAYFVRSKGHFSATSGTTPGITVIADVADAVGELGLQAYLARGVHLKTQLLLFLVAFANRVLQHHHFILFFPVHTTNIKLLIMFIYCQYVTF